MLRTTDTTIPTRAHRDVTVRLAGYSDSRSLSRLAALDSAPVPDGPLVMAEVGGTPIAALPLEGGRGIADPFHRTAALVEMLELRAAQLRGEARGLRRDSISARLRSRLVPSPS